MAGSPIKRARRAGIPIPNLGGRLSRAERVRRDEEPLEPDGELAGIAKQVLRNVALRGKDERNCVAAAKALADITAPREMKHSVSFEGFSPEEVEALTKAARAALEPKPAPKRCDHVHVISMTPRYCTLLPGHVGEHYDERTNQRWGDS